MITLLLVVLVAAAVAYALTLRGDEGGDEGGKDAATTSLTIELFADAGAVSTSTTLTCKPTGGNHPAAGAACAALAKAGPKVFEPVPAGQACTMIYGGPETANVRGTVDGKSVDAAFNRTNGCEISRWNELGDAFFAVPN